VVAVELGSDPARMRRDEVLDEMVVRVEEHELVEPATVVTFPD
jgi:hypothetical protein